MNSYNHWKACAAYEWAQAIRWFDLWEETNIQTFHNRYATHYYHHHADLANATGFASKPEDN